MKVLVNGEIMDRDDVKVDMEDRGYQFGDGVYEVVNVYDGVPFTLIEHTERLYRSAREIGLEIAGDAKQIMEDLNRVIKENDMKNGGIYLQVTRGVAPRTHQYDVNITPQLIAYPLPHKDMAATQTTGVKVITAEDLRWLRCDIKSLNLLYNIMIKQKAHEAGAFEAILVRDGIVTEGTSSNAFIIRDQTIYTHPANNKILNGITRTKLLNLIQEIGWKYKEQAFPKEEMMEADEVFISSTTSEVVPVISIDGVPVKDGKPGNMTKKIQSAFAELIKRETGR